MRIVIFGVGVFASRHHLLHVGLGGLHVSLGWGTEQTLNVHFVSLGHSNLGIVQALVLSHVLHYHFLHVAWEVLNIDVSMLIRADLVALHKFGEHSLDISLTVSLLGRLWFCTCVLYMRGGAIVESTL
jgi:hypothetical protein